MSEARRQHRKQRLKKSAGQDGHGVHRSIRSNKRGCADGALRERKRKAGMVAAEIWLPRKWHDAVIARRNPPGRNAGSFSPAYGRVEKEAQLAGSRHHREVSQKRLVMPARAGSAYGTRE